MLPVREIDPAIGRLVPIAKELVIPDVGRIDALLADDRGRLLVVECKLWRNPQARREVVGQILDYAQALAGFSYEALQRQISAATRRAGKVLYDLVREAGCDLDEARFVDRVSRDLKAGRFLLLIVGDGVAEGTQRIGEYLRRSAGLAFDFGMIEGAVPLRRSGDRHRAQHRPAAAHRAHGAYRAQRHPQRGRRHRRRRCGRRERRARP
jgi:hypothetical protein